MKKKLFFTFLSFVICHLSFVISPTLAFDPIIIKESIFKSPPVNQVGTKDVDYRPNDVILTDPTKYIKCSVSSISLGQTFDPRTKQTQIGIDQYGEFVYKTEDDPYDVVNPDISKNVDFSNIPYSNKSPENTLTHLGNRATLLTGILNQSQIQRAFYSFDLSKPSGTSNVANRSTPSKVLNCLKGQRLTKALRSLDTGDKGTNGTTCNEQIAWSCQMAPGLGTIPQIYSVTQHPQDPFPGKCNPIRLVDLALSFKALNAPVFQKEDVDCQNPNAPPQFPLSISILDIPKYIFKSNYNPVLSIQAYDLLKNGVEITDNCSIARTVEVCNVDFATKQLVCSPDMQKDVSIPLGSILYTADLAIDQTIPKAQTIPQYNLCEVNSQVYSQNIPNPISFNPKVLNVSGHVSEGNPFVVNEKSPVTYYIDKRIQEPINKIQTFNKNLIPNEVQKTRNLKNLQASSTNGYSVDPGNDLVGVIARNFLLPASWQSKQTAINPSTPSSPIGDNITKWCSLINKYATPEIPANVIASLINHESSGDPNNISNCGAIGLMQIMPIDADKYWKGDCVGKVDLQIFINDNRPTGSQLLDPEFNINFGVNLLLYYYRANNNNLNQALIQYGPMDYLGYDQLILNGAAQNPDICK